MKNKSILIILVLILFQLSCKKEAETNNFKFTSISGIKSGTTGVVSFIWTDSQNSNWNIIVRKNDGSVRNSFNNVNITEFSVANLGLDSTFTFGVGGTSKPSQSGTFNARIASTGDVTVTNIKP